MSKYALLASALLLSACVSQWDMQGVDPKDYYAAHPIKNHLESRDESFLVHFSPMANKLSGDEFSKLRGEFRSISPQAAQSVRIQLSDADMHNEARKDSLKKAMRSLGFHPDVMTFDPSAALARDDAQIEVAYLVVVQPHCPDWRTSPVTTYSNTTQGNFGCSEEVNLGLMVADPRDLVRGGGSVQPDADRNAKVIGDYKSGKDFGAASQGSGTTTNTGSAVASGVSGLTSGQ